MFRLACAAPNCLMRTYDFTKEQSKLVKNNYTVSFHKFPREEDHRLAWIAAAKKPDWDPSLEDSLCSLHFGDDCFDVNSQLYDHALPTIFFDDFRSYIKNLAKAINLEVDLESSDENEDILSKSLKNIGPLASDDTDDSDQIVECEISLSDDDDGEAVEVALESDSGKPSSTQSIPKKIVEEKPADKPEKPVSATSTPISNDATKTTSITESTATNSTEDEKTKNSNEVMVKLYALLQNGSLENSAIVEPTTSEFVLQLLNIVKMANLQNASIDSSVPNTYLITTRQEKNSKDELPGSVVVMETGDIISLITKSVKLIKKCEFHKSDLLTIICASPAIFLIKNVAVKSFDTNMNAVYVVTSENLIKPIALLNEKMEKERAKKNTISASSAFSSSPQTSTGYHKIDGSGAANKIPAQNLSKIAPKPANYVQPVKPNSNVISSRPSGYKMAVDSLPPTRFAKIRTPPDDTKAFKSVKVDLKANKPESAFAQSLRNLNLCGTPTLLQNVGSKKQNVLKVNFHSSVPSSLVPRPISNVIRLDLSSPIPVPKGAVYSAEDADKDVSAVSHTVADIAAVAEPPEKETPPPAKKTAVDPVAYLNTQRREIEKLENNILIQEREIGLMRRKVQMLKKRFLTLKNPNDSKMDEHIVEDILNKYLDQDAAQFFVSQMKVSGKTYTQFRWSEEDKLFALGLLYKHPVEYNILFQKFTLPSDKTLSKFVSKIKKAERDVKTKKS